MVIREALDLQTIKLLISVGDQSMISFRRLDHETKEDGWGSFGNCIALDDAFLPLLTWPSTFPLVVQLLGPNIHLI